MKKRILIIGEGYEEKAYLDRLLSFPIFSNSYYSFAPVVNAKGSGNLVARYQYEIQRGFNDVVLIFCDSDKNSPEFKKLVNDIGNTFFINPSDATKVIIYVNPVTLQVILSHFGDVELSHVSKKENSQEVERLTGVKMYCAKEEQIDSIVGMINYSTYESMKKRIAHLPSNLSDLPSTNFYEFLIKFEGDDDHWVEVINKLMK